MINRHKKEEVGNSETEGKNNLSELKGRPRECQREKRERGEK